MLDFDLTIGPFWLRITLSSPSESLVEAEESAPGDVFSTTERAEVYEEAPVYAGSRPPLGFRGR